MERKIIILLLLFLGLSSCAKDSLEVCGYVTDGRVDLVNYMFYLEVEGREYWVSEKTYDSFYVGDYICLEDY